MAFVYSKGPPYRQPITENFWFVVSLLCLTAINIWITLTPMEAINDLLKVEKYILRIFKIIGNYFLFNFR